MAIGDYKAGTAWLEIVPSFKGIEGALGAEVEKMAAQVDATLQKTLPEGIRRSTQAMNKEMRKAGEQGAEELAFGMARRLREAENGITRDLSNGLKKGMADAGDKGALEFAGAFKKALRARSGQIMGAIPKIQVGADASAFDKELARVRNNVSSLDRAFINNRIPEGALFNGLAAQRQKLEDMLGGASSHEDFHNVRAALEQANQLETMFRNMRAAGLGAQGAYGGAFDSRARETVQGVLRDLPQVNWRSNQPQNRELDVLRYDLEKLKNTRIGIDMDLGPFLVKMAEVEARLKALGDEHVELKYDTDKALAKIGKLFDDVLPKADTGGARAGDKFNQSFSNSVGKAAKALPDIKIGADTSDAHLEIAAVKKQLEDLGNEDIGVSIHEDVAILQIEDMKRRLEEVAKSDPSVQVKADIAESIAKMDEVLLMAGKIDKSNPTVKVKTDAAGANSDLNESETLLERLADAAGVGGSRLAALISVGIALGTVLVPAAGAAAVAIGGIAQAAAAAGAGIGVFALSISGISAGVQALDKYQNDQQKSAASLTKSQDQVAGAVDAVNSAERSLANTRENVADATKRAAQTVADAQRSVTDADREAKQAVEDLQKAYEEARRADEERALSLRDNALAQRQATLDIKKAKDDLDNVLSNPQATADEREQAKITYEQQVLQLDDLKFKQQQLQEEQDKANKSGIEGSDQVVAAKQKVQSANENVQKAEQRLADAIDAQQKQQREGSYQIAQAAQAVTSAQRQLEKATVSAGVAGGAALSNLQWQMQQLGPAGAEFAKFIYSLKPAFVDLRETAQSALLPGLQDAIKGILTYYPQIKRFVGDVGSALGGIFIDLVNELKDPTWQKFFGWIGDTAVPTLQAMWKFSSLIARGIADIVLALTPLNNQIGHGLLDMAAAFERWASTLTKTSGYQNFLEYVRTNGPRVVDLLKQMAEFVIRVVEAAAPVGATVLKVLDSFFTWVNTIPLGKLSTLVTLLAGFYAGLLALTGVSKVFGVIGTLFEGLQKAQNSVWSGLKGAVSDYRTELDKLNGTVTKTVDGGDFMSRRLAELTTPALHQAAEEAGNTAGKMDNMNRIMAAGKVAGNTLKKGLSSVVDFFGGPLGIAITGATIILASYYEEQAKIQGQADDIKGALQSIAQAYQEGGTAAVASLSRTNKAVSDTIVMLQKYGLSASTVFQAQQGDLNSQQQILSSLQAERDAAQSRLLPSNSDARDKLARDMAGRQPFASKAQKDQLDADIAQNDADRDRVKTLDALIPKLKQQYDEQKLLADVEAEAAANGSLFSSQLDDLKAALDAANPTSDQFTAAIKAVGDMSIDTGDKLDAYTTLADKLADSSLSASDKAGMFRDILNQIGASAEDHGPTFDALSGIFNTIADSALSASDKTSLLKQNLDQLYGAAINQNEAEENLIRTQDSLTDQLAASSAGFDLKTAKTEADKEAVLRNRDALEAALQATRDKYVADVAAAEQSDNVTQALSDARTAHDDETKAILDQIDPTYRNSAAVQDLVTKYGSIPPEKHTKITEDGEDKVLRDLYEGFLFQQALKDGLTPGEEKAKWGSYDFWSSPQGLGLQGSNQPAPAHADGGPILGYSPHKRADNIAAWLTAGEWVQPVDAVQYYGPNVMEAMRRRLIPRELFSGPFVRPGFADGGAVTFPYVVNWNKTMMPVSLDDLRRQLAARDAGYGPIPKDVARSLYGWINAAVQIAGVPSWWAGGPGALGLWTLIMRESGGRPNAINLWDSNAMRGDPSRGLMQTIGAVFNAYRDKRLSADIFDPIANIVAGINYIKARYGSIDNVQQADPNLPPKGYALGGLVTGLDMPMLFDSGGRLPAGVGSYLNATGKPETVLTDKQWQAVFELASRPAEGQGNTYNFGFRDTTLTESKFRAIQAAEDLRSRPGRAR